MTNNKNSQPNMQPLLQEAAKKLGTSPAELENQIKNGELAKAVKNLPPQQQAMLNRALSDKAACEKLLSSPQAQALMKKLSGK